MNERLIEAHRHLADYKSNVLLQVHDEIICEIHRDEINTIPNDIQEILSTNTLDIPLQVDMELCDPSWASKMDMEKALADNYFVRTNVEDFIEW